ncbi:hypothetical protein Tco_0214151, partial [Tanacetum coccineum]
AKTVNGEVQLQALVDGKKIIITESIVRRDLQLEDAKGVDCLPNATIFEQLTLMGYANISQKITFYKAFFSPQWKFLIHTILQCLSSKTTAWNEFSSTMASAIICLATNQKFNFSKYIFESMVKNLDNVSGNFLMYPRFVQVFVNQELEGMPTHKRIYIALSHTKKIFGNTRRVGKVCACARYQVNPNVSHLHAVKMIFRYLKGQPKLGLWYPKYSRFDLVAYTDSDYARASLDRKFITGGCQFLGSRLISWQYKKQTVVANSTTKAEYVAASSCCGQVLWIQNQLLVYGHSDLVSKRIERNGELKNRKRDGYIKNRQSVWTGIEVKAIRHNLLLLLEVNAARHNLLLLLKVNAARHKLKTAGEHTHNMVAFLSKTAKSEGFEQIAKVVNGEVQLQALIDGKKIIITESIVRRNLQLEDADGVDCLPNATIFEQLTLMGSKTTAWNEFSSTMASAIICLVTNQKFNFSKYIFESMVKNLDNVSGIFLMYPRSRRSKRKDTEVPQPSGPITNVADKDVNEEMDDSLERAATTATGLEVE